MTQTFGPPGSFEALAHEAQAVNEIKAKQRFTVVIGNPPYSNFGMMNKIPFILRLLDDYKRDLEEKKLNLDDDFIKFIRLTQHHIERTGCGVAGLITNNTFIDGITHRQMRAELQRAFSTIYVYNLHGSSSKRETCPDGSKDENVFDIQQGVGISLFVSELRQGPGFGTPTPGACVHRSIRLWNSRVPAPPSGPRWIPGPRTISSFRRTSIKLRSTRISSA